MSIGAIIICSLLAVTFLIMIAPIVLTWQFSTLSKNLNGIFMVHWIHPWIAFVKYNFGNKAMEFKLFGWTGKIGTATKGRDEELLAATPGASAAENGQSPETLKNIDPKTSGSQNGRMANDMPPESGNAKKNVMSSADKSGSPTSGGDEKMDAAASDPNRFTWTRLKKTIAIFRRGHSGQKLFRWVMRLLRLSLRIIRFDHLRLHAKAGVEDPADTGKFYGYFTALHSIAFSNRKNMDVRLEPRFMSNVFEVEGSVGLKTSIAAILMPLVVAIITFPYITVFFVWRRLKKVYTMSDVVKEA